MGIKAIFPKILTGIAGLAANIMINFFLLYLVLSIHLDLFWLIVGIHVLISLVGIYLMARKKLQGTWFGVVLGSILWLLLASQCYGIMSELSNGF